MSATPRASGAGREGRREKETKEARLRALMEERGLDALVLRRVTSFAWGTAGAPSFVNLATDTGEASLVYTRDRSYVVTSVIEARRLEEELGLADQGFSFEVHPWGASEDPFARLLEGKRVGADVPRAGAADVSADLARLRSALEPEEADRFRDLGARAGAVMKAVALSVRAGESELEIAARLASELLSRGAWPTVVQVAADERVLSYRHALPTERRLSRYALLSFCARRAGLVCSISRLVHIGPVPDELRRKQRACAEVDAAFLAATRAGATLGEVFEQGVRAYEQVGFPDEWKRHHQGGAAGYEPREALAVRGSTAIVPPRGAFAYNPSIAGTKSEDTVLFDGGTVEVLTRIEGWPSVTVEALGRQFERPTILELA